jgi:hypothetical protein
LALSLTIVGTFLLSLHLIGRNCLMTVSCAVAGTILAHALSPSRSEPVAGHDAHNLLGQFPCKKSWLISSRSLEDGGPLTYNCCPANGLLSILESSPQDESATSSGIMVVASALIHEHHKDAKTGAHRLDEASRKSNTLRNREGGHYWLYRDYFQPTKLAFTEAMFRWRYQMSRDFS